ncbi:MAG: lysophospholipase [Thermodesulfobacteriota bacterium]
MGELAERTGTVEGAGGLSLFYRRLAIEPERARLIIAHGLGEHSGRYGHVFSALAPRGFSIWALDHRGHGRSEGRRGHVDKFDHYLADLGLMVRLALEDRPEGRKVFLLGHSLGGLMSLSFALGFPELLDGVIASSPALGMVIQVPAAKKFLGRVMSGLWPGLAMGNELDPQKLSHDPEVVRAYVEDPLVHDRVTARFFTEFMAAMEATNQSAPQMSVPTLLQVAGDDHLVSAQASRDFFERLGGPDKTLHVYDGLYHEIYNEVPEKRAGALGDLCAWLEARI